jgi:hypothetical protein
MARVRQSVFALLLACAAACAFVPVTASGHVVLDPSPDGWTRVDAPPPPPAHLVAYVRMGASVTLRGRPYGTPLASVGSKTPFGSPRALSVAHREGPWLGVTEAGYGANRLVWIDTRAGGLRYAHTREEIDVDVSSRRLVLRRDGRVVRSLKIGVGRPGSPTPTGRFAVTDKLPGGTYGSYYGCCILALSATQPHLPAGWRGGNRIAIHGTPSPSDFGRAVSAGCLHASDRNLRFLMRSVPLGTPVVIQP